MSPVLVRKLILFIACLLLACLVMVTVKHYVYDRLYKDRVTHPVVVQKEPWITVFIHGTFCCPFGLFNFFETIQDDVLGTRYQKLNKKVRDDPYFYQDQAILGRGLLRIQPSFDLAVTKGKTLAAYPLLKAYEIIEEYANPGKEEHFYYLFGWSGLLSQKVRRFESIRLYNALVREVQKMEQDGIRPKIRLVGHSHAGNVMLSLALVREALGTVPKDVSESDPITKMRDLLKTLPSQREAERKEGSKRGDYFPTNQNLVVDELIILGCPIQPETDHCAASPMFKKVYNFYSLEDIIQRMDWISTQRYFSDQRLNHKYTHIIQARVMFNNMMISDEKEQQASRSFFASLRQYAANLIGWFVRQTTDPTHRELWFCAWDEEGGPASLAPLPMFPFVPLFVKAIESSPLFHDVDLNLALNEKQLSIGVFHHSKKALEYMLSIPTSLVNDLKQNVAAWKPAELSVDKKYDVITRYASQIS